MSSASVKMVTPVENRTSELSGLRVIIIIGLGVLLFILLFIFAKRQIMRFALRSRRGPHVPIGHGAKKYLKREIERRIDLIPLIVCEPKLLSKTDPRYIVCPGQQIPAHYYRLKAVDDVKILEHEITKQDSSWVRHPNENLRAYLLTTLADPMSGSCQRLIHQFCDLYEHARHDPSHFGDDEYQAYNRLLLKLVDAAKILKSFNSRKSSPSKTPQKQKSHNLLDPARLKPAYVISDENMDQIESRPVSLSVPPFAENETSV